MDRYRLFIDESGNLDVESKFSKSYILCGCSISEEKRRVVKTYADQIKFKYWGHTDVVFHSRDIAKNTADFEIFRDNPTLKEEFMKDLFLFLNKAPVILFPVIVDKEIAKSRNWNDVKIVKESSKSLILNFILLLLTKKGSNGHIIIEAGTAEKDKFYLYAFSYFISPDIKELNVDYKNMQKILTSISFVTKNNNDIEEQIADIFAYASACKYEKDYKKVEYDKNSYESKIISVLDQKLFVAPANANEIKMEFYNKIQPFCVLPSPLKKKHFHKKHLTNNGGE